VRHSLPAFLQHSVSVQRFWVSLRDKASVVTVSCPALHTQPIEPVDWFASYMATYVECDVRQVLNIQNLPTFQRFMRLCAPVCRAHRATAQYLGAGQ